MAGLALLEGGAEEFRLDVCRFLSEQMAPARTAGHADPADRTGLDEPFERALQREAGRRGYLGVSVDAAHGGGGMPPAYAAAFQYEAAYHHAPLIDTAIVLAGAPLMAFGSPRQQARLLPPMLAGEVTFCIAYTEPDAGNDLSTVSTTATRVGDHFLLGGKKALITGAGRADHCMTIAVTDPEADLRHRLTMVLVDMHDVGVTVV
ncbi:MAG TPA: acyl-CoA dehydrogenase family protein, partial [Acidimicrobiales bacterium]|nr:acyl-CoA dehydrogenase family protein [Acidimicrobiales bacterium]